MIKLFIRVGEFYVSYIREMDYLKDIGYYIVI